MKHKNHLRTRENVFLLAWSVYLVRKEDWDVTRLRCINAFMSKKYPYTKGDFKQAEEYTTRTNCLEAEARKFKLENKHTFLTERVSRNILQRKMLDFHDIQIFKSGLG